jgi:hypothetical protein
VPPVLIDSVQRRCLVLTLCFKPCLDVLLHKRGMSEFSVSLILFLINWLRLQLVFIQALNWRASPAKRSLTLVYHIYLVHLNRLVVSILHCLCHSLSHVEGFSKATDVFRTHVCDKFISLILRRMIIFEVSSPIVNNDFSYNSKLALWSSSISRA